MASISFLQAQNGDCIHLESDGHHVIIDSGEVCEQLNTLVERIKESGERIDLLVITHYDADHIKAICHILERMEKEERERLIGKVWFNATKVGHYGSKHLSAKDATNLAKLLMGTNIEWISCVKKGMTESIGTDSELEVLDGGKLYSSEVSGQWLSSNKCDWGTSLHNLEVFLDDKILDPSKTNAESMILVYKCGKKQVLLPGDAVPKQLCSALDLYGKGKTIKFDYVKLPHHGSHKNMTKEILSKIYCSDYIISTDGSYFYHPDKKLLLKIIKWGQRLDNSRLDFHMNYYNELFKKLNITEQEMNYYNFSCDGERTFRL